LPEGIRLPEPRPENETLEHFERFCYTLPDPDSIDGRFKLEEWQLGPLEDFFRGGAQAEFFQHFWEWPTGNGKSSLQAALSLHHGTYVVRRPRVFVVGGEMEHARNTTNAAAAFVLEARRRGSVFGYWWEPQEYQGGRLIPMWLDNPEVGIFAKSAGQRSEVKGGSSVEGKDPTLIIVEELHRHTDNGAAVSVLVSKTIKSGARTQSVKVIIGTTAGTNRDSHLGRLEDLVLDEEHGAVVERDLRPGEYYIRAVDADRETVGHIWAVPADVNPPPLSVTSGQVLDEYLDHVEKANPASWITKRSLRRVWKALGRLMRWQFLRQNADQWVTAGVGALDRGQWMFLHKPGLTIPTGPGVKVVVGLDRGYKWATTAVVPVWKPAEGRVKVSGVVILPPIEDGKRRRTRDVGTILEMMRERWPDMIVAFDRAQGGGDVAEELEEEHGITIVDHGQGAPFELASMKLGEYVENQKIEWDGTDEFSTQVLSAVAKLTMGGKRWRGESPDGQTVIDSFDALAMALNVATSPIVTGATGKTVQGNVEDYRIEGL
jgi:phage terminase large subunit-like protein